MSKIEEYELTDHGVKLRDTDAVLPSKKHHMAKKMEKPITTGKSQKQQMRFTKQNKKYQEKFGRAWND